MFRKLVMRLLSLGLKSWKECEKSEAEPLCLVIMRRKGKRRFSNWDNGEGMVRRKIRRRMGFAWKEKKVSSFLNMLNSRVFLRHRSWKVHEALGKFSKSFPYFSKTSIAGLKKWERWWDQGSHHWQEDQFPKWKEWSPKKCQSQEKQVESLLWFSFTGIFLFTI